MWFSRAPLRDSWLLETIPTGGCLTFPYGFHFGEVEFLIRTPQCQYPKIRGHRWSVIYPADFMSCACPLLSKMRGPQLPAFGRCAIQGLNLSHEPWPQVKTDWCFAIVNIKMLHVAGKWVFHTCSCLISWISTFAYPLAFAHLLALWPQVFRVLPWSSSLKMFCEGMKLLGLKTCTACTWIVSLPRSEIQSWLSGIAVSGSGHCGMESGVFCTMGYGSKLWTHQPVWDGFWKSMKKSKNGWIIVAMERDREGVEWVEYQEILISGGVPSDFTRPLPACPAWLKLCEQKRFWSPASTSGMDVVWRSPTEEYHLQTRKAPHGCCCVLLSTGCLMSMVAKHI